jgi:hypothetical protein
MFGKRKRPFSSLIIIIIMTKEWGRNLASPSPGAGDANI